jgi:hypothetical protein
MRIAPFAALVLLTLFAGLRADTAPRPEDVEKELAAKQAQLARRYSDLEQSLIRLATRLERSAKEEDRARAAQLRKAIELAGKQDVRGNFDKLIQALESSKSLSIPELTEAMTRQKMLAEDIKAVLALLLDNEKQLHDEIETIRQLIKDLDRIIRDQKIVRTNTEGERVSRDALAGLQVRVKGSTEGLARRMGAKMPDDRKPAATEPARPMVKGAVQVQQATVTQKNAIDKIQGGDLPAASGEQDQSIRKLVDARRQLEEILRQLRKEEVERVLAGLRTRCERMLHLQLAVYAKTVEIDTAISKTGDRKPTRDQEMKAAELSTLEDQIAAEAGKAIQLLETEGSAVAFPEVFMQLRDDTKHVSRRLGKCDVGSMTQTIERDVINTLREMIGALKKAEDEIASTPPPPPPGGDDPSGDDSRRRKPPRLLDQIAELKMVRAMQVRVNLRTAGYSDRYQGEQAKQPEIQSELKNLSERQKRIADITTNLPKEKNP